MKKKPTRFCLFYTLPIDKHKRVRYKTIGAYSMEEAERKLKEQFPNMREAVQDYRR